MLYLVAVKRLPEKKKKKESKKQQEKETKRAFFSAGKFQTHFGTLT
jgi:hypothetical protein